MDADFFKVLIQMMSYTNEKQVLIGHIPYQSMLNPFISFRSLMILRTLKRDKILSTKQNVK